MNVCYIVVGYTPTVEKEEVLMALLRNLKKLKQSNTDIMLVLHNIPSESILNKVDHFIYDKNNDIIPYYPSIHDNFAPKIIDKYYASNGITVFSPYSSHGKYHGFAAMSLIFQGLLNAKSLGYDICHVVEYDTDVESLEEFIENEAIFRNSVYTSVFYYLGPDPHMTYCQVSSYNLNYYDINQFDWKLVRPKIKEIVARSIYGDNNGMSEIAFFELLHWCKTPFKKRLCNLTSNDITLDLSKVKALDATDLVSMVPYIRDENIVSIFVSYIKNVKPGTRDLKFVVNGIEINRTISGESEWFYFDVCEFSELKTIDFYVDGELTKQYDFINEIDKDHFYKKSRQVTLHS